MSKYLGIAYNLRLPPELKDRVQESAKSLNRSMNADIVARLEQSFEQNKPDKSTLTTEELMEELSNRFGGLQVTIEAAKDK